MTNIDITQEIHQNFIDYSYEANSQRAFPDARDGLKPGQRACLWEFFTKGYLSNKPHVKSAKASGGIIANWWPHGDVAIYETFVRMSQPWINNVPEIDFHGSNGNLIVGSAPASARYTEARLAKSMEEGLFSGIKKNNVDMILNFSEDEKWPSVLPAIFPRLAVNGSQGIGVTIAQTWLPNNLKEMGESILEYINSGSIDYDKLCPDFPSGGIIINRKDVSDIYKTGKGKVVLQGIVDIKGDSILITELPYQVYVEPFIDSIKDKLKADEVVFKDIKDIKNKSAKKKILIDIECAKGTAPQVLKNLYKYTDLRKSYNANQYALVGKTPKLLTFKDYLTIYMQHNIEVVSRETAFDIEKSNARLEVVNGLLIALEDIDNVIKLIKQSKSSADAETNLIAKYEMSSVQAKAIVGMRLGKLANLEQIELQKEKETLSKLVKELQEILGSYDKKVEIVKVKLESFIKKYGKDRKTQMTHIEIKPEEKEIESVVAEDVVVSITHSGDIKRVPSKSFKVQKKNGKGAKSENEAIMSLISTNTIDALMAFTSKGKMYRILVDNIPVGTSASKGVNVGTLINLEPQEKVIAITSLDRKSDAEYVIFITKQGLLKKTSLEEYTKVKRSTGIVAIKIKEGDSLANVTFVKDEDVIVVTKQGMSIHFGSAEIAAIGRNTSGVKAINLAEGDEVIAGLVLRDEKHLAIFSESGLGKKTLVDEFPYQGRGGKGLAAYKISDSTGPVAGAALISDDDNILVLGQTNSICVSAADITEIGRIGVGTSMIKGSRVKSIVKL